MRDQPDSLQVGIDDLVPVGFVLLQRGPRRGNTGVVDDDLNRTETRFGSVQRGLDARGDRDVHYHAVGMALGSGDLIDGLGQGFRAPGGNGHLRAPRRQQDGEKPPEPA